MEKDFIKAIDRSRRLAWRFLLPGGIPHKTICWGNEDRDLTNAAKSILITVPELESDSAQDCHLAIAENPTPSTIQAARDRLNPNGCLYAEWSSGLLSVGAITRQLRDRGFARIDTYLVILNSDRSSIRAWLSLDSPSVTNYYLSSRLNRHSSLRRRILWLHYRAFLRFPKLFLNFPWLISLSKAKIATISRQSLRTEYSVDTGDLSLVARLNRYLASNERDLKQISLLLKIEDTSTDQAIIFPFLNGDCTPNLAVKVALGDWENSYLEGEAKNLQILAARCPQIENIPRLAFADNFSGNFALAQTFIAGIPLTKLINTSNLEQFADLITDWAIEVAKQTRSIDAPSSQETIAEILTELATSESMKEHGELIQITRQHLQDFDSKTRVLQHRDLGPWNIHYRSETNTIGVIDWSEAAIAGIPGSDLIYSLTMLALQAKQSFALPKLQQVYRQLLAPQTSSDRWFTDCYQRYVSALKISVDLSQLCLSTWIIHTHLEPDNQRKSSIFFSLWQAELDRI